MKKVTKEVLKDAAERLMFQLDEEEYDVLLDEFSILEVQMAKIGHVPGLDLEEPMTFPFDVAVTTLREDEVHDVLSRDEALMNAYSKKDGQIKLPKVIS